MTISPREAFSHLRYEEATLPNGLKVMTAQSDIPAVDVQLWSRAGYRYEEPGELGYAHLLEHMLLKGTEKYPTPYEFAMQVQGKGGVINAHTSPEAVAYAVQLTSEYAEFMVELVSDLLFRSRIDEEVLENEKRVVLEELKMNHDNNERYLYKFIQQKLFHGHPLSNTLLDTEETTKGATPDRLRRYLGSNYRPDQSALIAAGGVPHGQVVKLAEKHLGEWKNPEASFDPGYREVAKAEKGSYHEQRDTKQTFLARCSYVGTSPDQGELATLAIVGTFLGGNKLSLLFNELRTERGLVYRVRAIRQPYQDAGLFIIATESQQPGKVIDIVEETVSGAHEELTRERFEQVKQQVIGAFTLAMVQPGQQADRMGWNFITFGRLLPPDEWVRELSSVTREQAVELMNTYLARSNSVWVSLGRENVNE